MGRWTPLILMAGGLAILLGTLLGINFPMDGRRAENPEKRKESQVLPANINVNSTATGSSGENGSQKNNASTNTSNTRSTAFGTGSTRTAQNSSENGSTRTAQGQTESITDRTSSSSTSQRNSSGNNAPIRALW